MASNDLQTLYKLRDALKREEYVKTYNNGINEKQKAAANNSVSTYLNKRNAAYKNYESLKNNKSHDKDSEVLKVTLYFMLIPIAITLFLILVTSSNILRSLLHLFCTSTWAMMVVAFVSLGIDKDNRHREKTIKVLFALFAILAVCTIIFASLNGVSGFWKWFGSVFLYIVWPIANFFFLKPVVWLSLTSFFVITICGFSCAFSGIFNKTDNEKKNDLYYAEFNADVKQAKADYDRACQEYNAAYNAEYARLTPSFQKLKKADTYTQEKRALSSAVPANLQNLDMVNKLIWCIEERYADTIVQARNWYLQQSQNAAMMKKLDGIASNLSNIKDIQEKAAAEAAAAHQEALAAINNQTNAINKQTNTINKQLGKLNDTAKQNAEANKKTAYYADKIHTEIKY